MSNNIDNGGDNLGCEKEDNSVYNAKLKELESLVDRYQKLSKWIDKVVEFDFNRPTSDVHELKLNELK